MTSQEISIAEYVNWFRKAIIQALTVISSVTAVAVVPAPYNTWITVATAVLGQVLVIITPNKKPAAKVVDDLALEEDPVTAADLAIEDDEPKVERPSPRPGRHRAPDDSLTD